MEAVRTMRMSILNDGISYEGNLVYNHSWGSEDGSWHVVVLQGLEDEHEEYSVLYEEVDGWDEMRIDSGRYENYDRKQATYTTQQGPHVKHSHRLTSFKVRRKCNPYPQDVFVLYDC